jgi:two-component system NtrC family response regulator
MESKFKITDRQPSLLIVEEERESGGWLGRFLQHAGYRCHEAANGAAGLSLLEKEKIQIVVSDIKLPDMDFTDFVKTVKNKKPYVEVIFIAAQGSIYEAVRAIKSGAFSYLVRGRNDDALLPLLAEANEIVTDHERSYHA